MGRILDTAQSFGTTPFIRCGEQVFSYADVREGIEAWRRELPAHGIAPGEVVSIIGSFSPRATILMLALLENGNIVVPLDEHGEEEVGKRHAVARVSHCFRIARDRDVSHDRPGAGGEHPLLVEVRARQCGGIILFTSGTTGEGKAAVHVFDKLIEKFGYNGHKKPLKTLVFLKFDHIGGINTMLSVFMNGGCMTVAEDRSPAAICRLIERDKVELLPTTPSFLNMLILAKAHQTFDLTSLRMIAYGTEPMPESTLRTLAKLFPDVKLKQTYGLTELGIFSTQSKSNDSTYMAIREGDVRIKVVDGVLFVKADSAMLGYLNAPSPFDAEGWYNTGDRVEVKDGFLKVLGRQSESINVGGEKVYPAEVESVLLEMPNVKDVVVRKKESAILGHIVMATFVLQRDEQEAVLRKRLWEHCRGRLEPYKIPRHIVISKVDSVSSRLKRNRSERPLAPAGSHGG